jgi:hypothetical protein
MRRLVAVEDLLEPYFRVPAPFADPITRERREATHGYVAP